MLVNRNGVDFRATGKDIKDSLEKADSPPSVSGATLVGSGPGFAGETFTTQPQNYDAGSPAATPGLKARVSGPFAVVGETSPITGVDDRDLPDLGAAANWSNADAGSGAYLFAEKEGDHSGTYVYNNTNSNNIVWTAPTGGKLKGTGDKVYLAWNSRYTGATQYAGTVCRITTQFGAVDVTCVPATTTEAFLGNGYEIQELRFIKQAGNSYNGGLSWISPTSSESDKWISGQSKTTLILTDDTNLHNGLFEVGDVVDKFDSNALSLSVSDAWYNDTVTDAAWFDRNQWNNNVNKNLDKSLYTSQTFNYSGATVGDPIYFVTWNDANSGMPKRLTGVSGDIEESVGDFNQSVNYSGTNGLPTITDGTYAIKKGNTDSNIWKLYFHLQ